MQIKSAFYSLSCRMGFCRQLATKKGRVGIEIGYLDSLPAEIDGGLCTFYKSLDDVEKDRYVLTNDSAENAYVMVNGKQKSFRLWPITMKTICM